MPRHCTYCDSKSHLIGSCPKLPHVDVHCVKGQKGGGKRKKVVVCGIGITYNPDSPKNRSRKIQDTAASAAKPRAKAGGAYRTKQPPRETSRKHDVGLEIPEYGETILPLAVTPPTKAQIKAEIKKLKAMKPFIPVKSMFGDNNHNSIDADIAVMEKNLTEEQIEERYLPRDEDGDDTEDDHESGKTSDIEHSARMTRYWMDGEKQGDGAPSKGWESLAMSRGWKP